MKLKLPKSKALRWLIAYAVMYGILSFCTSIVRVGIFTSAWILHTNSYSLYAHDMEYDSYRFLRKAGQPSKVSDVTFELDQGQLYIFAPGKTTHRPSPGVREAIWSDKYSKLLFAQVENPPTDENGLWSWDIKDGFRQVLATKEYLKDISISIDGQHLVASRFLPSENPEETRKNKLVIYSIASNKSEIVDIPFTNVVPIMLSDDEFIFTEFETDFLHSFLTNGTGLVYRWSRKTGKKEQVDRGGNLVSATIFNGSVWAIRQTMAWRVYPWCTTRSYDNVEIVKLSPNLDKVELAFPL